METGADSGQSSSKRGVSFDVAHEDKSTSHHRSKVVDLEQDYINKTTIGRVVLVHNENLIIKHFYQLLKTLILIDYQAKYPVPEPYQKQWGIFAKKTDTEFEHEKTALENKWRTSAEEYLKPICHEIETSFLGILSFYRHFVDLARPKYKPLQILAKSRTPLSVIEANMIKIIEDFIAEKHPAESKLNTTNVVAATPILLTLLHQYSKSRSSESAITLTFLLDNLVSSPPSSAQIQKVFRNLKYLAWQSAHNNSTSANSTTTTSTTTNNSTLVSPRGTTTSEGTTTTTTTNTTTANIPEDNSAAVPAKSQKRIYKWNPDDIDLSCYLSELIFDPMWYAETKTRLTMPLIVAAFQVPPILYCPIFYNPSNENYTLFFSHFSRFLKTDMRQILAYVGEEQDLPAEFVDSSINQCSEAFGQKDLHQKLDSFTTGYQVITKAGLSIAEELHLTVGLSLNPVKIMKDLTMVINLLSNEDATAQEVNLQAIQEENKEADTATHPLVSPRNNSTTSTATHPLVSPRNNSTTSTTTTEAGGDHGVSVRRSRFHFSRERKDKYTEFSERFRSVVMEQGQSLEYYREIITTLTRVEMVPVLLLMLPALDLLAPVFKELVAFFYKDTEHPAPNETIPKLCSLLKEIFLSWLDDAKDDKDNPFLEQLPETKKFSLTIKAYKSSFIIKTMKKTRLLMRELASRLISKLMQDIPRYIPTEDAVIAEKFRDEAKMIVGHMIPVMIDLFFSLFLGQNTNQQQQVSSVLQSLNFEQILGWDVKETDEKAEGKEGKLLDGEEEEEEEEGVDEEVELEEGLNKITTLFEEVEKRFNKHKVNLEVEVEKELDRKHKERGAIEDREEEEGAEEGKEGKKKLGRRARLKNRIKNKGGKGKTD